MAALDRRKKYTRMVLRDSLIQLLKERPLSSITVKDICELADINRSTFYAHYADQYDLLEQIEEEIMTDLTGYLNQFQYENEEDALPLLENLLEYFASKRDIAQTLLNERMDSSFQLKVMTFAHKYFMEHWTVVRHLDEDLSEYMSTFIISGCIHVMKAWLSNDMDKSPREIAEVLYHLINKGLFGE